MIGRGLPKMGHEGPFSRVQFHPDRLDQPLRWKKPRRIFVCSMGDLWHRDVEPIHRALIFDRIRKCPQHTFMLLTKRAKEMFEDVTDNSMIYSFFPLPNVIGMVTAENQEMADERIPYLLKTPFSRRGVSIEPYLSAVDIGLFLPPSKKSICICDRKKNNYTADNPYCKWPHGKDFLDWVICGGEAGAGARFLHPHWVENLRDQCTEAGVPFFFKGWGTKFMKKSDPGYMMIDGREWKEFPK
jgi:protein gp37